MKGFDESFWALEDKDFGIRMKKMAKAKGKKLVHLKKPVIVSTRKNKVTSFSKMLKLYFKLMKRDSYVTNLPVKILRWIPDRLGSSLSMWRTIFFSILSSPL